MYFTLSGLLRCYRSKRLLLPTVAVNAILWGLIAQISYISGDTIFEKGLYSVSLTLLLMLCNAALSLLLGTPRGFWRIMRCVERVPHFRNEDGEPPLLIKRQMIRKEWHFEEWTFRSIGIGFGEWGDPKLQGRLENALDIVIIGVDYGSDNTLAVLKVLSHPGPWPDVIPWDQKYLPSRESQLCVGLNRSYPVVIDLQKHPHYMIGGETGSGKTVLILSLIHQSMMKGFRVFLVDMKHFVDYTMFLQSIDRTVDDEESLHTLLSDTVEEMHRRLAILRESGCHNLAEYNLLLTLPLSYVATN